MEHIVKKVIMASAGTGKTYRLSLEFISLLLKYKDYAEFDFSQIVVMTFTRKATAEIREKILDFLQELADQGSESALIIANLEKISAYKWQANDRIYIKEKLLKEILQRKDLLQVSTIDSFTTNIFKSMIAPYLRIKDFNIDNNSNDEIMPKLLDFIFSDEEFHLFEPLLKRINSRTVEEIQKFIKSLIDNRWILDYYENGSMTGVFSQALNYSSEFFAEFRENNWLIFKESYLALVDEYNTLVYEPQDKPWHKLLLKDYKEMAQIDLDAKLDLNQVFASIFSDPKQVTKQIKVFFKYPLPFAKNGKKEHKEIANQMEARFIESMTYLADFYLVSEILPQQKEVLAGWTSLCNQYDKLKFNLGKFTYNDVTFYSYRYLYEESLSLIDRERGIVTNLFYEQLVSRIRFLLIDEFQDTSFNQFSILIPIINELVSGYSVKDYSGVIVVGDPKQSLYSWRGGERGIMEMMPKSLEVEAEDLSQCYRSSRPVIDMVNHIFTAKEFQESCLKSNFEWNYAPVTAKNWDAQTSSYNEDKEEGGELFYWEYNSYSADKKRKEENEDKEENSNDDESADSFEEFAKQIKLLHQSGKIGWGDTAILVRTHKHANNIANELNKLNIPNNIESSGKLLEHKAVELLLTILKFKLLKDRFSLLHILRSDLILLDSHTLAEILKVYHKQGYDIDKENEFSALMKFPQIEKLLNLINKDYYSQAHFIREVIANYDFNRVCLNEIDWKNIYTFLELVINFELAKVNAGTFDLFGFVEYCQKQLKTDSEILQEGLQLEDSISILTVHKSKGLGFKNVFLYWELSTYATPNKGDEFKLAYSFDRNTYLSLTDFVIYSSATQEKVLKASTSHDLMQDYEKRNIIEAVDVFYVALTRAEEKLGLFFKYKSKDDFTDFMAKHDSKAGSIALLITAYKNFFRENNADNLSSENLAYFHFLALNKRIKSERDKASDIPKEVLPNYLQKYLTDYSQPELDENKPLENLKKVYLEDRHQLFGNACHEYLTYIKYYSDNMNFDSDPQFKVAINILYRKFGSLLPQEDLKLVKKACQSFIMDNKEIFSPKWDKVFAEKTVYHKSKEYRIDRMMVCSQSKEVMIIDYKTGGIDDKDQVEEYIKIIAELPFVIENRYEVTGKFIKILLDF